MLFSCNNEIKKLHNLYNKELSTAQGPLFPASKLFIYSDSTFKYEESGPALKISKGRWVLNEDRSSLTLISSNEYRATDKSLLDTVFLDMNGMVVRIKNRHEVEVRDRRFSDGNSRTR